MAKRILADILVLLAVFFSLPAHAHLDGGADARAGEYIVDYGFSPSPIAAGDRAILAFNLLNASSNELVVPDFVWARISKGEEIIFSGELFPSARHVAFTYVFSFPGNYSIDARFVRNGGAVAQASFAQPVVENAGGPKDALEWLRPLLAIASVISLGLVLFSRRHGRLQDGGWRRILSGLRPYAWVLLAVCVALQAVLLLF